MTETKDKSQMSYPINELTPIAKHYLTMNPEVIAQEYLIELDLKGKVNRNEKIDLQDEIKKAVRYGYEIGKQKAFRNNLKTKP